MTNEATRALTDSRAMVEIEMVDGGWQPIETHRKDGTSIIGVGGGMKRPGEVRFNHRFDMWETLGASLADNDYDPQGYCRPTHWMPFPPPPGTAPDMLA